MDMAPPRSRSRFLSLRADLFGPNLYLMSSDSVLLFRRAHWVLLNPAFPTPAVLLGSKKGIKGATNLGEGSSVSGFSVKGDSMLTALN